MPGCSRAGGGSGRDSGREGVYSESQHRCSRLETGRNDLRVFPESCSRTPDGRAKLKTTVTFLRPPSLLWGLRGSLNKGSCVPPTASSTRRAAAQDSCPVTNSESPPPENSGWAPTSSETPERLGNSPPPPGTGPRGSRKGSLPSLGEPGEATQIPQGRPSTQVSPLHPASHPSCALARGLVNMRPQ